jgi:hypothetical protein
MLPRLGPSSLTLNRTRFGHRSVTSFYSNLVTRPTGRAVRMGVESQLAELGEECQPCLSVLDFTQVRVIDYSCADEIVAKLLLRYAPQPRPAEVFFLVRGLEEHHEDAVQAVLERHGLLVAAERSGRGYHLLGPSDPFQRSCWSALLLRSAAAPGSLAEDLQLPETVARSAVESLIAKRVALELPDGRVCGVPLLLDIAAEHGRA